MSDFVSMSCKKGLSCLQPFETISVVLGFEVLFVWRACWAFFPNGTEDGGTESSIIWRENLSTEATARTLACCQTQLWDNVDASKQAEDGHEVLRCH